MTAAPDSAEAHAEARNRSWWDRTAKVSRRFGLRTMLLITAVYAILFATMEFFQTPPTAAALIAVWFTLVGLGQIILFRGRKPREASVLIGGIAPAAIALAVSTAGLLLGRIGPAEWLLGVLLAVPLAIMGAMLGYVAGCALAGAFLLAGDTAEPGSMDEAPSQPFGQKHSILKSLGFTMTTQPTLETPRLILRPLAALDAGEVQRLAGDPAIASTTLMIPHPYPDGAAERWIATMSSKYEQGTEAVFAIVLQTESRLIGAIGLRLEQEHLRAELGYWIGKDYWGQGFATEAGRAMLPYGFNVLGLQRIFAHHFARNPASGRVLAKLGMEHEGRLRGHVLKWGIREDLDLYGILKPEFEAGGPG